MSENVLQKSANTNYIPVTVTDLSIFDDNFFSLKERFTAEMRRIEEEMNKFTTDLTHLYSQSTVQAASITSRQDSSTDWENITGSPLVEGEGENKKLKLQFDVTQFAPEEITVTIKNDVLQVSAKHEEKSDRSSVFREYVREFHLPRGTDPDVVVSSLSKDGVLTVEAPLPNYLAIEDNTVTT